MRINAIYWILRMIEWTIYSLRSWGASIRISSLGIWVKDNIKRSKINNHFWSSSFFSSLSIYNILSYFGSGSSIIPAISWRTFGRGERRVARSEIHSEIGKRNGIHFITLEESSFSLENLIRIFPFLPSDYISIEDIDYHEEPRDNIRSSSEQLKEYGINRYSLSINSTSALCASGAQNTRFWLVRG